MNKTFLIFFGPPGSGKGTQTTKISAKLGIPKISMGKLFRHEVEIGSDIGKKIEAVMNSGRLVSDKIVDAAIERRLKEPDIKSGAIFDGFPRDNRQQKYLLKKLAEISKETDDIFAVYIKVSDKEIKDRLSGRRVSTCGKTYHIKYKKPLKSGVCDACGDKLRIRPDDKPSVVKDRLSLFHKTIEPAFKYWEQAGKLIVVDGENDIKEVQKDIIKALKKNKIL